VDTNQPSPLSFPCRFPIKAMGLAEADLPTLVTAIARRHAPDLDDDQTRVRPSSNGRYVSVTVVIEAVSQEQLDAIYRELSADERILVSL